MSDPTNPTDPIAEIQATQAEYVRNVLPVVMTYTRQVLGQVDLELLRRQADPRHVPWLDALIVARDRFGDAERLAAMSRTPINLPPIQTPEGTAS